MILSMKNISWKKSGTKLVNTFLVMLLIGAVTSCGNRKTTQSINRIKSDSISVENSLVLKQNIVLHDIGIIKPFDAAKPMIIDGKEYFNCTIEYDKSKFERIDIDVGHKEIKITKDKFVKEKESAKTDYTILYLGIVFICIFFVCLYFYLPTLKFDYMKK